MLKTIDRIQIATPHAQQTAGQWAELLGAEPESDDKVAALSARRVRSRLGRGYVEFLEPDGTGAIQSALNQRGRAHLFAGGISTSDFKATVARLRSKGIEPVEEGGQAFTDIEPALGVPAPLVISPAEERASVGTIDFLYEVTLLTGGARDVSTKFAELFDLNESHFVPIASKRFAYDGVLTLFDPHDLHRFEIITPHDEANTMGRFFKKAGPAYYMCFAETPHMNRIEQQAMTLNAGLTIDRPEDREATLPADQMWVHPPALGGVMLGLSRPSMAWQWSGHPERVEAIG